MSSVSFFVIHCTIGFSVKTAFNSGFNVNALSLEIGFESKYEGLIRLDLTLIISVRHWT